MRACQSVDGVQVVQALWEADAQIAALAVREGAVAILSSDSDFLVFPGPGLIPLSSLLTSLDDASLEDLSNPVACDLFTHATTSQLLGLSSPQVPFLSSTPHLSLSLPFPRFKWVSLSSTLRLSLHIIYVDIACVEAHWISFLSFFLCLRLAYQSCIV